LEKTFIIGLFVIAVVFFLWQYVFNIYEVRYDIKPDAMYADNESVVEITCVPLNSFGFRVPLRSVEADYEVVEGADIVEVIENDREHGSLKLKSLNTTGVVKVRVLSNRSLLPGLIEIPILPNSA